AFGRKLYADLVVDPDASDPADVPDFGNFFGPFHAKVRKLGNVHEPVFPRENFDERAELLRGDDTSLICLTDLNFTGHAANNFFRARHAFATGGVNVHRAVVFDINFSAGLRDNSLNGFTTWPDQRPNLLWINFDCLDPWRVLRQF